MQVISNHWLQFLFKSLIAVLSNTLIASISNHCCSIYQIYWFASISNFQQWYASHFKSIDCSRLQIGKWLQYFKSLKLQYFKSLLQYYQIIDCSISNHWLPKFQTHWNVQYLHQRTLDSGSILKSCYHCSISNHWLCRPISKSLIAVFQIIDCSISNHWLQYCVKSLIAVLSSDHWIDSISNHWLQYFKSLSCSLDKWTRTDSIDQIIDCSISNHWLQYFKSIDMQYFNTGIDWEVNSSNSLIAVFQIMMNFHWYDAPIGCLQYLQNHWVAVFQIIDCSISNHWLQYLQIIDLNQYYQIIDWHDISNHCIAVQHHCNNSISNTSSLDLYSHNQPSDWLSIFKSLIATAWFQIIDWIVIIGSNHLIAVFQIKLHCEYLNKSLIAVSIHNVLLIAAHFRIPWCSLCTWKVFSHDWLQYFKSLVAVFQIIDCSIS